MITVLSVILAGYLISRWSAQTFEGWKAYAIAVLVALIVVPAAGYLAAHLDGMLFGGRIEKLTGIGVGLGLAIALFEAPLIVWKRKRQRTGITRFI